MNLLYLLGSQHRKHSLQSSTDGSVLHSAFGVEPEEPPCTEIGVFAADEHASNAPPQREDRLNGFGVALSCSFCGSVDGVVACPCRRALYCNRRCQEMDYEQHRTVCTKVPVCNTCGAVWHERDLMQCFCRKAVYCGIDCQAADHERHSQACGCYTAGEVSNPTPQQAVKALLEPRADMRKKFRARTRTSIAQENANLRQELSAVAPWLVDRHEATFAQFVADTRRES